MTGRRVVVLAFCLVVCLVGVVVVYAQGGSLRCPSSGSVAEGTPFPPALLSLDLDYLRRCSSCFSGVTATPGEYSIVVPVISTPVPSGGGVGLSLSGDVLNGLSAQPGAITGFDQGPFWRLEGWYSDSPPVYQFWIEDGTLEAYGQSVTLGPFDGPVHGVVFDVTVQSGTFGGWGVGGPNIPSYWQSVSHTLFPLDEDYSYGGYMPLLDSEFWSGTVRVCVGVGQACDLADGVDVVDALPVPVSGEFTLGLYATDGAWVVRNLRLIGEFSSPASTPVPTSVPVTPTPSVTPYLQFYAGQPVKLEKFGSVQYEYFCTLLQNVPSVMVGAWLTHTSVGSLSVSRMGGGGSCPDSMWGNTSDYIHSSHPDVCSVKSYAGIEADSICNQTRAGFLAAMGAVWPGYSTYGVSISSGGIRDAVPVPVGGSIRFTVISAFNHGPGFLYVVPIYYGYPPSPPGPTPTSAPTLAPTSTPTPVPGSLDCTVIEWRENVDDLADFGFETEEWVRSGDCYTIVPAWSLSIPAIPLLGFDGLTLAWDGLQLCIDWVTFPVIEILGVRFSSSLALVVVVGFLVVRLLQW